MKKICSFLYRAAGYIAGVLLGIMMIVLVVQVFRRRVLGNSLTYAEELIRFLEIWLVFLGASLCVKDDTHPTVTIFFDHFPQKIRPAVKSLVYFLILAVGIVMMISGVLLCMKYYRQMTPTLRISYAYVYAAIPLSGLLIDIQVLGVFSEFLRRNKEGRTQG